MEFNVTNLTAELISHAQDVLEAIRQILESSGVHVTINVEGIEIDPLSAIDIEIDPLIMKRALEEELKRIGDLLPDITFKSAFPVD